MDFLCMLLKKAQDSKDKKVNFLEFLISQDLEERQQKEKDATSDILTQSLGNPSEDNYANARVSGQANTDVEGSPVFLFATGFTGLGANQRDHNDIVNTHGDEVVPSNTPSTNVLNARKTDAENIVASFVSTPYTTPSIGKNIDGVSMHIGASHALTPIKATNIEEHDTSVLKQKGVSHVSTHTKAPNGDNHNTNVLEYIGTSPTSKPIAAPLVDNDTGVSGEHIVKVPMAGAVTLIVLTEVFFFTALLIIVIFQVRRFMKNKSIADKNVANVDADREKGIHRSGGDPSSSGIGCSTSTPFSHSQRNLMYPGLSSALSDNLHYMTPMMSPIDSTDYPKRCTFSATPSIPADISSKQIQGALSEDRQRCSTWLDFTSDSKRALYAMTRSKSTPEQLASRSLSMASSDVSGGVETSIGKIDPAIYRREELAAKFVGRWKQKSFKKEVGKLAFQVHYDSELELLTVVLINASNLPQTVKDCNGDIFVKIALDPDHKRRSMSSSIQRGSRGPEFKQNFAFRIAIGAVREMTLKFTVCEYDHYSHPISIGCVNYSLADHKFDEAADSDNKRVISLDLEKPEKEEEETSRGDLMITLTYLPNAERVNLIIMKARNVRLPEWGDKDVGRSILDTFVKITIMRCGKVVKHKNTKVVRRSCSPVFNEAFSIDRMRLSEMPECCFVLSVCVRLNHFRSHRVIGRCVVGGKDCAVGDGLAQWNDMADSPRSIVARWHKIQD